MVCVLMHVLDMPLDVQLQERLVTIHKTIRYYRYDATIIPSWKSINPYNIYNTHIMQQEKIFDSLIQ